MTARTAQPDAPDAMAPFQTAPDARIFRFRYDGPECGLHAYLAGRYSFGRTEDWRCAFYPARVRLNGAPVAAHTRVAAGDEITYLHLRGDEPPPPVLGPALYEDAWLLALPKPDTLPVNPAGVYYFGSLAILARETRQEPALTPIHRLDLETSGPLLFARHKRDLAAWHALFHRKALTKRYRALVHGRFPPELGAIAGRIVPDDASRILTRLRLEPADAAAVAEALDAAAGAAAGAPPGKAAAGLSLTRVHTVTHHDLGPRGTFSELVLEPVTGKTNQLRVHLSHVGHPIVGDKKYHPDESVFLDWHAHRDYARLAGHLLLPRQALHCEALTFLHPFSGAPVEIRAPAEMWPDKMAGLLPALRASPGGHWARASAK